MENLDEAHNVVNFLNIDEEESCTMIGEPPWRGEETLNPLLYLIRHETHEMFDTERIHSILHILGNQIIHEDVKLFLIKHNFLRIAMYLLETEPPPETILHILQITINLCYINEVIDDIGKFKSFVQLILCYLDCKIEKIIRKILRLLRLATYEIQINSKSDWIIRFKECKFFGRRIISLLKSSQYRTGIELIRLLRSISEINLPNQTSFLEQLFDIDKLNHSLLISYIHVIPELNGFASTKEHNFIENWYWFLTMRHIPEGSKYNNCFIVSDVDDSRELYIFGYNEEFLEHMKRSLEIFYKVVTMLLRTRYVPKTYGKTIDYINSIIFMITVILNEGGLHFEQTYLDLLIQHIKKLLNQYCLYTFAQRTCQHIVYILKSLTSRNTKNDKIVESLINLVLSDCNITPEIREKVEKAKIEFGKIRNVTPEMQK